VKRWQLAAISLVLVVSFFLLREHWGHMLGLAPYLILLACPLLHLLHHHGGHHHDGHHHGGSNSSSGGTQA
jgi:hypothetical protein